MPGVPVAVNEFFYGYKKKSVFRKLKNVEMGNFINYCVKSQHYNEWQFCIKYLKIIFSGSLCTRKYNILKKCFSTLKS